MPRRTPMLRSCEGTFVRAFVSVAAAVLLVACGNGTSPKSAGASSTAAVAASNPDAAETPQVFGADSGAATPTPAASPAFKGRSAELLNPDASTMVFLYYDLAGMTPPIDNWVEDDGRVKYAPALEKASRRSAVRAELESGAAAVRGVGAIRLSMNANLSEYDPTYGEFLVRALAPSSVVPFDALGQKVSLKFGNGRTAQIWQVPLARAQAIRDKIHYIGNVSLDVLLRITAVQPGLGGGTITADVVEYELQENRSGFTLGRVQVAQK